MSTIISSVPLKILRYSKTLSAYDLKAIQTSIDLAFTSLSLQK